VSLFTVSELAGNCNALGVHKIREREDMPKILIVFARADGINLSVFWERMISKIREGEPV